MKKLKNLKKYIPFLIIILVVILAIFLIIHFKNTSTGNAPTIVHTPTPTVSPTVTETTTQTQQPDITTTPDSIITQVPVYTPTPIPVTPSTTSSLSDSDFILTYENINFSIGMDSDKIIGLLGKNSSTDDNAQGYIESDSTVFSYYNYGYPYIDPNFYIKSVCLKDNTSNKIIKEIRIHGTLSTNRGISVGDSYSKMLSLHSTPDKTDQTGIYTVYSYFLNDKTLSFQVSPNESIICISMTSNIEDSLKDSYVTSTGNKAFQGTYAGYSFTEENFLTVFAKDENGTSYTFAATSDEVIDSLFSSLLLIGDPIKIVWTPDTITLLDNSQSQINKIISFE